MSPVFDVTQEDVRESALAAAGTAIAEAKLVVLPTDTVYGVGADPFTPGAVAALLAAKGRGREKPPAVLVPNPRTVDGLAMSVPSYARRLIERFWPGGLTLIFRAQPSLMWDLGDTNGTVGLRMPDDEIALALLEVTGPLAVTSANRSGEAPVTTIADAGFAFGPSVEVYLDGGVRTGALPSTIIDCTKADPVLLRQGDISPEQLREVLGPIDLLDSTGAPISEHPREDVMTPEAAATDPAVSLDKPAASDEGGVTETAQEAAGAEISKGSDAPETLDAPETTDAPDVEVQPASDDVTGESAVSAESADEAIDPYVDLNREERAEEPTQLIPLGGVGAEPPFEREPVRSVELPTRTPRSSD